ncbi:lipocalin-like domain-containing protein [Vibrio furnissii]|uniref:lipocalin-like domain-containing protein n=1 Tax=Vibrio furnissii TaxID=29494 RepID=UPI001EEB25D2|nr:lipocalin-like domain-containing protein [Vibrio furnissii]MCG6234917.1 carotenoid 1,2-hydratase [Vibrio furnissii]MCG6258040.1 carotenoid 1,2-hydratase [Vibrio furnissii]
MKTLKKNMKLAAATLVCVGITTLIGYLTYLLFFTQKQESYGDDLHSTLTSQRHQVYEPVLPNHPVTLPDDFAFHPQFQHEWWHFFANVTDENGQHYGVQWNYFRIANDDRNTIGWQSPQLYLSHTVISTRDHVWREQRIARGGIGQAGMNSQPFRLWIDNWNWRSLGNGPLPGLLSVNTDSFALLLQMTASGPYVLPGDKGYQTKHDLLPVASYNIQAPFIQVRGKLQLSKNTPPVTVEGTAWVSKEWGSGLLAEGQQGWDWFVLELDDSTTLTVSRYRHSLQLPYVFGTLSTKDGKVIALKESDIQIKPVHLTSLANGKSVPLQWHISIPSQNINISTSVLNQHLWLPFALPYWEGPIYAVGSHRAKGFMQLTGY